MVDAFFYSRDHPAGNMHLVRNPWADPVRAQFPTEVLQTSTDGLLAGIMGGKLILSFCGRTALYASEECNIVSHQNNPRQEYATTYFVQNRASQDEMSRLRVQDQMITASMGGALAEQPDPTRFHSVLDIGSGTGGWLLEVAKTYPDIAHLVGIDINPSMVKYAQAQAEEQGIAERVQYQVMDAMRALDFPDASFDLVNVRFATSYLRTWDWPDFLMACQRVTKPGGVIRLTESDNSESSSPSLTKLYQFLAQALYGSGHLFNAEKNGVANELARLLAQYGLLNVQRRPFTLDYQFGTAQGQLLFEDAQRVFRTMVPFLQKWTTIPDDYDAIYQQAFSDLNQPDCISRWSLFTVWGTKRGS